MFTIGLLIFLSIMLFYTSWVYIAYGKRKRLEALLYRQEEEKSTMTMVVRWLTKYFSRLLPQTFNEAHVTTQLRHAGLGYSYELFTLVRVLLFVFPVFLYPAMIGFSDSLGYTMGGAIGIALFVMTNMYLKIKIKQRSETIEKELLPLTELFLTSTQAGLTLQQALERIAKVQTGLLPELFTKSFEYSGSLMTKEESFTWMKQQTSCESLHMFIDAIVQSEKLGTPLTETLRGQLQRIRTTLENKGMEMAQTMSNKLIFPALIFEFIPLFIILLVPQLLLAFRL